MFTEHEDGKKFQEIKKLLIAGGSLALLFSTLTFAFTQKQRDAIVERDEGRCQNPKCQNGGDVKGKGIVHRIFPEGYSLELEEIGDVNFPENGIYLCDGCHSSWGGVYTDKQGAFAAYGENIEEINAAEASGKLDSELADILREAISEGNSKNSFDLVSAQWQKKLKKREIYWDPQWDGLFYMIAIMRTMEARKNGWEFPVKSKGNNFQVNQEVVAKINSYIEELSKTELATLFNNLSNGSRPARAVMYDVYKKAMG